MIGPDTPEPENVRPRLGDVTWRETDESIVLLDHATWKYRRLNRSGSLLWKTLIDGATVEDLRHVLKDHYGLTAEAAETDVRTFLDQLAAAGLLEQ